MANRQPLSERLLARNAGSGLSRRSMVDGGEVYSGALAQRALSTLGARAMTLDGKIMVGNQFDTNNPIHMAEYAHERHHQSESGGSDVHGARDSEEIAARAIERMVLHRIEEGEDMAGVIQDAAAGKVKEAAGTALSAPPKDKQAGPWVGYVALLASGLPHHAIVQRLADEISKRMGKEGDEHRDRTTELPNSV